MPLFLQYPLSPLSPYMLLFYRTFLPHSTTPFETFLFPFQLNYPANHSIIERKVLIKKHFIQKSC